MKKFFPTIFFILILISIFPATTNAIQIDQEYTVRVGAMWGFPGERVTFRVSNPAAAEVIRRKDGQYCVAIKEGGDFYVSAIFQEADGTSKTKIFLIHAVGNGISKLFKDRYEEKILQLVNEERRKKNLQPLTLAKELSVAAAIRAEEQKNFWSHTRPDGSKFQTAIKSGIYKLLGENLNRGATSPEQVVEAWMNSPLHRENILYPDFREMGVAVFFSPETDYKYFWAQWFGTRK